MQPELIDRLLLTCTYTVCDASQTAIPLYIPGTGQLAGLTLPRPQQALQTVLLPQIMDNTTRGNTVEFVCAMSKADASAFKFPYLCFARLYYYSSSSTAATIVVAAITIFYSPIFL